jgi:hypothetical protein
MRGAPDFRHVLREEFQAAKIIAQAKDMRQHPDQYYAN